MKSAKQKPNQIPYMALVCAVAALEARAQRRLRIKAGMASDKERMLADNFAEIDRIAAGEIRRFIKNSKQ